MRAACDPGASADLAAVLITARSRAGALRASRACHPWRMGPPRLDEQLGLPCGALADALARLSLLGGPAGGRRALRSPHVHAWPAVRRAGGLPG